MVDILRGRTPTTLKPDEYTFKDGGIYGLLKSEKKDYVENFLKALFQG